MPRPVRSIVGSRDAGMAAVVMLLVILCAALGATGVQAIEPQGSSAASSPRATTHLLGVSVGGTSLVSVSVPGVSSSSAPLVSVSVLGTPTSSTSSSSTQLVGVAVEGAPLIGVSVPNAPTVSIPAPLTGSALAPSTAAPPAPPAKASEPASSVPAPASGSAAGSPSPPSFAAVRHPAGSPGGRRLGSVSAGTPSSTARRSTHPRQRHPVGDAAVGVARNRITSPVSSAYNSQHVARAAARSSSDPLDSIGRHIPLSLPVPDWSKPIILALLLLAIWFGVRSRLASLRARRLEGQRATLLRDVGAMQAALVPEVPACLGGLAVSVAYRPAEGPAAGGDFYDLFVPAPGKVAIILGDVAGHGSHALTQAALTRYTLRAYLQAGLAPRATLALAGQALADPVGRRFATVAVGVYEERDATLTYALAGHPPPILRGCQACEPVTICSSPPLGWGVPTGRRQSTVSLPAGAEACFFSDGLIEARCEGSEEGGLLGRERLSEILTALGPRPLAADLLAEVRVAARAIPDDMAACILAPQAAAAGADIYVEELETDERALTAGNVRRFLEACRLPAPEIARAIELAGVTAAAFDTAVLRIERRPTGVSATVSPPASGAPQTVSRREPLPAGESLLRATQNAIVIARSM
jgi:Stage II sporulation protein E (SpoIIE)